MAVFVSASDENAGRTHRDRFLFGGWIGAGDDWSTFAQLWERRVLSGPPRIPYLHMTEIRSPAWRQKFGLSRSEAEIRIDEAFAVIDETRSLYPIGVSVDAGCVRDNFKESRVRASTGGSRQFDPDYICFLAYAWMTLSYIELRHPEAEKVDFVVERKGHVTKYMQEFHSNLSEGLAALGCPSMAKLVGELIPAGKERVQLQAADLLCWHTARHRQRSMEAVDQRRYAKIARRGGQQVELTADHIAQMRSAVFS